MAVFSRGFSAAQVGAIVSDRRGPIEVGISAALGGARGAFFPRHRYRAGDPVVVEMDAHVQSGRVQGSVDVRIDPVREIFGDLIVPGPPARVAGFAVYESIVGAQPHRAG